MSKRHIYNSKKKRKSWKPRGFASTATSKSNCVFGEMRLLSCIMSSSKYYFIHETKRQSKQHHRELKHLKILNKKSKLQLFSFDFQDCVASLCFKSLVISIATLTRSCSKLRERITKKH